MSKKFTDNLLAYLYLKIADRYKDLREQSYPRPRLSNFQIYQQLVDELNYEMSTPSSSLYQLEPAEQFKAFTVLNTVFNSFDPSRPSIPAQQPQYVFVYQQIDINDYRWHNHRCYCPHNDFLFTWLLLDSLSPRRYHYSDGGCFGGNNHHGNSNTKKEDVLFLLFVAAAALTVGVAFIAAYYLLKECLDSVERMRFNEGWLKAIISLSSAIGSAVVSGLFASVFASAPLAAFAIAAGISNPVGAVVLGIICLTIIGAAVGCFITNQIQNHVIKQANKDAIDPLEPHRYGLTQDEEETLRQKGFDPVKVKCAIVALHEQIGKEMPPRLHRIFSDSDGKQALLDKIRKLRRGEAEVIVEIGTGENKQSLDLRPFPPVYYAPPVVPQYQQTTHGHPSQYPSEFQPSAPPSYV